MMRSTLMVVVVAAPLALASCKKSSAKPVITPIESCPDGAAMSGAAPPAGLRQVCQKGPGIRHGATREWWEDHRERSYSEWWDGQKHGRFTLWFKDGRIKSQGAHVHGAPAGEWKYFDDAGVLSQHQTFPTAPPPADWLAKAVAGQPPPPPANPPAPLPSDQPSTVPPNDPPGAPGAPSAPSGW